MSMESKLKKETPCVEKKPTTNNNMGTSFSIGLAYAWLCSFVASVAQVLSLSPAKQQQQAQQQQQQPAKPKSNEDFNGSSSMPSTSPSRSNVRTTSTTTLVPHSPTTPASNNTNTNTNALSTTTLITNKKKTLILDLDETLVHSSIKPCPCDITIEVEIEGQACSFFVMKRPHVDTFLEQVSEWYHVVVFTASMQQYADPLLDRLDPKGHIKGRLFRESCLYKDGNYIKDLSNIGQDLTSTIIIDNSPVAYSNNKENALPIETWMGDNANDEALLNMLPFLNALKYTTDVRSILSLRYQQ